MLRVKGELEINQNMGCFYSFIVAKWFPHMVPEILVNIGSGNDLSPVWLQALPAPMLTYYHLDLLELIWVKL